MKGDTGQPTPGRISRVMPAGVSEHMHGNDSKPARATSTARVTETRSRSVPVVSYEKGNGVRVEKGNGVRVQKIDKPSASLPRELLDDRFRAREAFLAANPPPWDEATEACYHG